MKKFVNHFLPYDQNGIYLVGGSVRDQLIGRDPSDFDIISNNNIHKLAKKIAKKNDGKIIPIGKQQHVILRVISPQITIDIAPLQGNCIEYDLLRRDFTINAIAYNLSNDKIIDPTNGIEDIKKKQLKMVSNTVFQKDPIRLIRAYRIALELNFSISKSTSIEILNNRTSIRQTAGEKIWLELIKIFNHPKSYSAIHGMKTSRLIFNIFYELLQDSTNVVNKSHLDSLAIRSYNYIESLLANKNNNKRSVLHMCCKEIIGIKKFPLIKYALLLHNIRKDIPTHYMHRNHMILRSSFRWRTKKVNIINKRLKLSSKQQAFVNSIMNGHAQLLALFGSYKNKQLTPMNIFRLFEKYGPTTIAIISHIVADTMVKAPKLNQTDLQLISFLNLLITQYQGPYCTDMRKKPLITGHDLIKSLQMKPSPKFRYILEKVRIARISGEISNKDTALKMVKKYIN